MAGASSAEDIVREFWRLMATNDFNAVRAVLTEDFVLDWPQSRERIRGPIARVCEYWPEPFVPPANRRHLVELVP